MAALPYIQLYVADYLADTAHLSTLENGAYLLLIFNYWQRGESFKAADERSLNRRLASVARLSSEDWESVRPALEEFFQVTETEWFHNRIERDLDAVKSKSTKAKAAGLASAAARMSGRSTDAERTFNHTDTDTDTDTDKVKTLRRSRAFTRPTIDDVAAYCAERGNRIDPQAFLDYYESNGWKVGRSTMKDWQAAIRTWEKRDETNQRTNAANGNGNRTGSTRQYIDKLKQLERDAAHMGDAPFPTVGDDLWPPMDIVPRRP
jgi:uncharacterized protein YdaU (DUF1376 family)